MRPMLGRRGLVFVLVLGFLSLVRADPRAAAPLSAGDLDPTFSGDGRVITNIGGSSSRVGVAVQPDGRIVVVGSTDVVDDAGAYPFPLARTDFALARYNPDGSLDSTFAGDGTQTTDFGDMDFAFAVAIDADGKILVAGSSGADVALARYNPDGSLDITFSDDGKLTTDFAGEADAAYGVALQSDGAIVIAGYAGDDFAVARYTADGSLDTSFPADKFPADGRQTTSFGGLAYALAIAIQADDKIVVAGVADPPPGCWCWDPFTDFALARYNADGSLDTTFSGDGKQTTDFRGEDRASGVAIQADGRIVAVGSSSVFYASSTAFALARYNPDGSLDPTFGGGQRVSVFTSSDWASGVALQADGKIVVVGCCGFDARGEMDFAVARYERDGSLDVTFSDDGLQTTDFGGSDEASGVALQNDGSIVVVGNSASAAGGFALARYEGGSEMPDTFAPETTITGGPEGTANDSTPTFTFESSETGSTFACRVDHGAAFQCTSPRTTPTLGEGAHTFEVQATDAAGNADASPARRSFSVDTTPPETTIPGGPTATTTDPFATLSFVSSESDSSFTCRLDGGAIFSCTSPYTTPLLKDGEHSLEVHATDAAGNTDLTPGSRTWTTVPGYQRVVLATAGLVAYWRLGEVSGAIAAASSGTSDGSYRNGVLLGRPGALLNDANVSAGFDGLDDYVSVADNASLHVGDSFTLEAWIKRAAATSSTRIVLSKGNGAFQLGLVNNVLTLTNGDSRAIAKASISTTDTTAFHHVVATKSGSTVKLYIDGIDRTGPITNRTVTSTSTPLNIGRDTSGSKYFAGMVDEVAIYNVALGAAQIQQHFKASGR